LNYNNCSTDFFRKNYLRQPSIDFDICTLSSSGDVVYKERAGDIDNSWLLIFVMTLCAFKGKPQIFQETIREFLCLNGPRSCMLVVNVTDDDATACAFPRGCCKVNGIARSLTSKQTYSLNSTIIFRTSAKSYRCFPVFFHYLIA
jgi:hypothetical protein